MEGLNLPLTPGERILMDSTYKSLASAPEQLSALRDGTLLVVGALRLFDKPTQKNALSAIDVRALHNHIAGSEAVLSTVETALDNLRHQRVELERLSSLAQNLTIQAAKASSFYESLRRQ